MDAPEPELTPFTAVSAHTSKLARVRETLSAFLIIYHLSVRLTESHKLC